MLFLALLVLLEQSALSPYDVLTRHLFSEQSIMSILESSSYVCLLLCFPFSLSPFLSITHAGLDGLTDIWRIVMREMHNGAAYLRRV